MLYNRVIPICFKLCLFCFTKIFSQEQLGLRLDNFAGANALALNPAANATNPLTWDINLAGFGFNINTNIGYLENASVLKATNNAATIGPDPTLKLAHKNDFTLFYNVYSKNRYNFSLNMRAMGPSVSINLKNGHSFGFFTGVRAMASSHSLPYLINPVKLEAIDFNQTFKIEPFKAAGLVWSEIGVNYAYKISSDDSERGITIGANVKYLSSFQGFFVNNYKGTEITQLAQDTFRIDAIRLKAGFTTNYDTDISHQNGTGLGFDVGVVVTTEGGEDTPYGWRFGASLLDLGKINLTNNTEVHDFVANDGFQLDKNNFKDINPVNPRADILNRITQKFSSKAPTKTTNAFQVGLPSALQLQADYAFANNLFINALLIQRVAINEIVLERDNLFAVTPRYETRWVGASMSLIVQNWQQLRVGLNARLAFLSFGTDNLGSWLINGKLSGTDAYIALKINPFTIGFLEGKLGGHKWQKKVNCYRF